MGGPTRTQGDETEATKLAAILESATEDNVDSFTHGFHAYPARMHPMIARGVLEHYATAGDRILDPFCGSGTVLVEALLGGMRARGVDLNPVAVRVAAVKCQPMRGGMKEKFEARIAGIVAASRERVKKRIRARAPLDATARRGYDTHVLLELAGIYEEIGKLESGPDKNAALVLLSAIVVKFSRQRADTSNESAPKRIGKGVPTSFFERKTAELLRRWDELAEACSQLPEVHRPKIVEGNTSNLRAAMPGRFSAHLILTSPPYGGTYDYVDHHALRYPWFGVSPKAMLAGELGARRHLSGRGAHDKWDAQVGTMLASMASVLEHTGQCVLLVGDAEIGGKRVNAAKQLERLAPEHGLRAVGWASQRRTDWRGGEPRAEHLVLLRR